MSCFIFTLPRAITCELFTKWFSHKDVNRLDSSCSSFVTRKQYQECISSSVLVLSELQVDTSKFFEVIVWLNLRSCSVAGLSVPPLFLRSNNCEGLVAPKTVARLKKINFEKCSDLSDDVFKEIVRKGKHLVNVSIGSNHHPSWITDKSLLHLSQSTNVLKYFQLAQNSLVTDVGFAAICETNIGVLEVDLRSCEKIGDESMLALAKYCPSLQVLKLTNKKNITESALSTVLRTCLRLREFVLTGCKIAMPNFLAFEPTSLRNLTTFALYDAIDSVNLRLRSFLWFTSATIVSLTLCEVGSLVDDDFSALPAGLPRLTSLCVESCPRLTATGLCALLQKCSVLREARLFRCDVTHSVVESLARCPHLAELSLTWCSSVTDAALAVLFAPQFVPPLSQVTLDGCEKVGAVTVKALASFVPTLTRLNVRFCPKVTAQVVAEVAARNPMLTIVQGGL